MSQKQLPQTDVESLSESKTDESHQPVHPPISSLDENSETRVSFYRGTTYYDALRSEAEGFDVQGSLTRRQVGRDMTPGLYATRNREVAKYYAYLNSDPYVGFAGQGGPALMEITLSEKEFREIASKYGVIDNRPIEGVPQQIPPPHQETLFPYAALPELFSLAQITVERLPMYF